MALEDWFIAHARVSGRPHKRVTLDDKLTFFQQLATLVCSGTPLMEALQTCAEQSESTQMRETLREIASRVAAGSSLHAAAASYTNVLEHHWVDVIRTGEIAGTMGPVLLELVEQIREARETRRKLMGAMIYPIVLIFVAVAAVTVMLWVVVPTFANMFRDMGAELPGITQSVVRTSDVIVHYGVYIVVSLFALALAFRQYLKTDSGRHRVGAVALTVPLVGELMVQAAMYRFASNIALLLKSGVPMLESLIALGGVFRTNPVYRNALHRVQGRVAAGRSLADSLQDTGLFPGMMTNMVRTGEESAQLATVMEQVAPYYKEKMESLLSRVGKLVEPVIIVGLGSILGLIMMAIYLPMFDMAGKVH